MTMYGKRKRIADLSCLLGAVSGASLMALAPGGAAIADDSQQAPELSQVTVTAEHIEENSQRVPIAITTVSADTLQQQGAISVNMLPAAVPAITTVGSFWSNMYIRGVGTNSNSPNNEPAVATYIDGVYDPSPYALATTYFNNIRQISVLKGPQGTLFGRDSTGGVVQIATADPKQAFGGNASIGYANYDTVDGSAYLTGGIAKDLAADLAVIYHNQGTGWGFDAPFDTRINWRHNTAARSKWLYAPAETTKVTVALDYSNFTSDGANNQLLPGSFASSDRITTFPGNYNADGTPNVFDSQEYGASVTVDQLIGSLHAVSITSYRNVHGHWLTDSDDTPNPFLEVLNFNDADYVTQELRLNNQNPGVVKWQVGAFFFGDNVHVNPYTLFGTKEPGGFEAFYGNQATRSTSVFGQATVRVAERTHLTLGTRFTDETLRAYGDDTNSQQKVISGPFYSEVSYRPWTWRASLDHQFTEQVLGYVSYDHGFSSGGYNLTSPGSPAFLPETVNAYEMGMKDEFLNHRVRLNVAAFYYDYKNLQVAVIPGNATQIFTNAAAARNYGTDADLDFAVTDDLTVSASVSWLNAKYVNYPFAEGWTPLGAPIHVANASGKELTFSPPFTSSVSANYRVPTRIGAFAGQLNLSYHDRYYVSPTEEPVAPVYFLLNASVSWWSNASEPLGIRLWGENLLGAYYPANLLSSSIGWYGAYAAPRTYGITLTKDF